MKRTSKSILFIVSLLFLAACGSIGENYFRLLNESQLKSIKPFDPAIISSTVNNSAQLYIYEINSENVREVISNNRYTWVHIWPPYCHADACENINYFQRVSDHLKDKGVEFLLVSNSYWFPDIKKKLANSEYNKPIFVLQDSYYGHKMDKARMQLYNEFRNSQTPEVKYGYTDFFFRDTTLIFGGTGLTREMVDSLIVKVTHL